jgi:serine/threonine-protein kinase
MRPRNVHAGIPRQLEDVTLRALARDPNQRFPTAAAFRAALLAAGRDSPAPPVVPEDTSGADATAAVFPTISVPDKTPAGAPPPAFVRTRAARRAPTAPLPAHRFPSHRRRRSTHLPGTDRRTTPTSRRPSTATRAPSGRQRATTADHSDG